MRNFQHLLFNLKELPFHSFLIRIPLPHHYVYQKKTEIRVKASLGTCEVVFQELVPKTNLLSTPMNYKSYLIQSSFCFLEQGYKTCIYS